MRLGLSGGKQTVVSLAGVDLYLRFGKLSTDDFVHDLNDLGLRMNDMRPVLDRFGAYLTNEHIPEQFRRQGTPKRWAPLSPKYEEWKRRHYGRLPILVLTGQMRAGFRWETGARTLRVVNRVKSGQRGRGEPRWVYHQFGTSKMPARPVLQVRPKDIARLRELAREHLAFYQAEGMGL
jgi:phage gpG-like protein